MSGDFGATTPHPKTPIRFRASIGGRIVANPVREIAWWRESGFDHSVDEVFVKKTATLLLLIVLTLALAAGCRGRKSSSATGTAQTTQTIAAAAAHPAVNGGAAVTQTVAAGAGRSQDDGGVHTNPQTDNTSTAKPARKPAAR